MQSSHILKRKGRERSSLRASVRPLGRAVEIAPPGIQVAVDFAELEDGTRIEIIQDPDDPTNCLFAVCKDANVRYERRVESGGRIFVPVSRRSGILANVPLAKGALPYEKLLNLIAQMLTLFAACLDLPRLEIFLLAIFALSTWFPEKLPVAPYVAFVGLPRSGKTTALRVLSLACRRPLLVTDVTAAALYGAYDGPMPTVLIDETRTASDERTLRHILRSGSTPGFSVLRRGRILNCYGPKVVTWTDLPNDSALISRCVVISLQETDRKDLVRPTAPHIIEAAENLQQKLLRFRLEKFDGLALPGVPEADQLQSRGRDIYEALALPIGSEPELCRCVAQMIGEQERLARDPLSPAHAAVLHALFLAVHFSGERGSISLAHLTQAANAHLKRRGETLKITPHAVGKALTSLGFADRTRQKDGWTLSIDQDARRRIHLLIGRYGVDASGALSQLKRYRECVFCDALFSDSGNVDAASNVPPAGHSSPNQ
jgi:hypothetical protein